MSYQILLTQTTLCVTNMLTQQLGHELIDFFYPQGKQWLQQANWIACTRNQINLFKNVSCLNRNTPILHAGKKLRETCQKLHYPHYLMPSIHLRYMSLGCRGNPHQQINGIQFPLSKNSCNLCKL